ncbi:hypothetical protein [Marinomonas shanghaiensis]|uniref:hypothetical protein n=1 Tax=Marinomonas shanghaiensis TaxID=2202418 RepID=UPI003A913F18
MKLLIQLADKQGKSLCLVILLSITSALLTVGDLLPRLKERGVTIVAITHDDKYFDAADRVYKIDAGQLTEFKTNDLSNGQRATGNGRFHQLFSSISFL